MTFMLGFHENSSETRQLIFCRRVLG